MTLKDKLEHLQAQAKERTVRTQNIEYDLETLVKKIKKGVIKLDPEYQRRHRWTDETSSRLIESLILNIPVPLVYISQDVDVDVEDDEETSRYSVIDGQQRLTAIVRYFGNHFSLCGLDTLEDLNGTNYKDLPPFLIRRLEERTIRCLRIDSTIDSQVKYDIFERLNSGAVKLEPQELRNAVSRGPFNDLIKELAKNADYRILLQIDPTEPEDSKKVQKMEDVELVLRFFSLLGGNYKNVKGGFRNFLSTEMDRLNKLSPSELETMGDRFLKTMSATRALFGDEAFSKFKKNGKQVERVSRFNAAVFDALSVNIAEYTNLDAPTITPEQLERYYALFTNADFADAVAGSVNDRTKIRVRIEAVGRVLKQ